MMRRSALIESKLREALEFFNDRPSYGLRRDPRRTSYRLASEIDAALARPRWRQRLLEFASGAICGVAVVIAFVVLFAVLPETPGIVQ